MDDEGPGIAPEHLDRVFERFWRAPGAPAGGTGLGLAIARWIAERHGGSVHAENRAPGPRCEVRRAGPPGLIRATVASESRPRPTRRDRPRAPAATGRLRCVDLLGYLFIGLLAGGISGWFVGTRSVSGCLPTIAVGIVGAVIGGWLAQQLGFGPVSGFLGALVFGTLGAILVRIVLRAIEGRA